MHHAERLKFIYKGAKTKRFHTADTLTEQTVGEHSFGVAWLVWLIAPTARKELLLAALAHDLAEHIVGDVSSPAKRRFPALKTALDAAEGTLLKDMGLDFESGLTDFEHRILKIADMLDGMLFCVRERRMGSRVVDDVYTNFRKYLEEVIKDPADLAFEIFVTINLMWENIHVRK